MDYKKVSKTNESFPNVTLQNHANYRPFKENKSRKNTSSVPLLKYPWRYFQKRVFKGYCVLSSILYVFVYYLTFTSANIFENFLIFDWFKNTPFKNLLTNFNDDITSTENKISPGFDAFSRYASPEQKSAYNLFRDNLGIRVIDQIGERTTAVFDSNFAPIPENPLSHSKSQTSYSNHDVIIAYSDFNISNSAPLLQKRTQFLERIKNLLPNQEAVRTTFLPNLGMEIFEFKEEKHKAQLFQFLDNFSDLVQSIFPNDFIESKNVVAKAVQRVTSGTLIENLLDSSRNPVRSLQTPSAAKLNDKYFSSQWAFDPNTTWGANVANVWNLQSEHRHQNEFVVAVIDSGIDLNHPDLQRSIWKNPDEICYNGIDDDNNGYIDDCFGWNFVNNTNFPDDDNGHGTAVAGILAATPQNDEGIAGICWNCKIMVLKALNSEIQGIVSNFVKAVDYAISKKVLLSNNSFGGKNGIYPALETAVQRAQEAGMLFVAASGNYGCDNDNESCSTYPASYDFENIIAVGATDKNGDLVSYSNYGKKSVDLGAPGVDLVTTWFDHEYKSVGGTSFASPFITGAAGIIWSMSPNLTFREVKNIIISTVKVNPQLQNVFKTSGTVNIQDAVKFASNVYTSSNTCNNDHCGSNASCSTSGNGKPTCTCNNGYQRDGNTCVDIDECAYDPCGPVSICVNLPGAFQCACKTGFQLENNMCKDINECDALNSCPESSHCLNFSGTYHCVCEIDEIFIESRRGNGRCAKISSPNTGPCIRNGGCPRDQLCQAKKTFIFTTNTCICAPGYVVGPQGSCIPNNIPQSQHAQYIKMLENLDFTFNLYPLD